MRLYLSNCIALRRDREQREIEQMKAKLLETKCILFEKTRNSSLLWTEIKPKKAKTDLVTLPEELKKAKEELS